MSRRNNVRIKKIISEILSRRGFLQGLGAVGAVAKTPDRVKDALNAVTPSTDMVPDHKPVGGIVGAVRDPIDKAYTDVSKGIEKRVNREVKTAAAGAIAGGAVDSGIRAGTKAIGKRFRKAVRNIARKAVTAFRDRLKEEAPANNVGGGNIAGLGVGPQGEPGRSAELMPMFKRGRFAGKDTFIVPTKMFHKGKMSKRKGQHWKTYFSEDEGFNEIREYAVKNPKKSIILQDENTGALYVARYGSNA